MKRKIFKTFALLVLLFAFIGSAEEYFLIHEDYSSSICSQACVISNSTHVECARIAAKQDSFTILEVSGFAKSGFAKKNYNYENTDELQRLIGCGRRSIYVGGTFADDNIRFNL